MDVHKNRQNRTFYNGIGGWITKLQTLPLQNVLQRRRRLNQNRRQKVVIGALRFCGGLYVREGRAWHPNLTKIPLTYSVSYFILGGLELCLGGLNQPKPPGVDGTGLNHRVTDTFLTVLFTNALCFLHFAII